MFHPIAHLFHSARLGRRKRHRTRSALIETLERRVLLTRVSIDLGAVRFDEGDVITVTAIAEEPVVGDQWVEFQAPKFVDSVTADDFEVSTSRITISDGATRGTATVRILNDNLVENTVEVMSFRMFSDYSEGVTPTGDFLESINVHDMDSATAFIVTRPAFESQGSVTMDVVLSKPVDADIVARVVTEPVSASAATDFVIFDQELTIPAGELKASFTIELRDDDEFEPTKEFLVRLESVSGDFHGFLGSKKRNVQLSEPKRLTNTTTPFVESDFVIQPDGVFYRGRESEGGMIGLYTVSLSGREPQRLDTGQGDVLQFEYGLEDIVYRVLNESTTDIELMRFNRSSETTGRIVTPNPVYTEVFDFDVRGNEVYYLAGNRLVVNLFVTQVSGGEPVQLSQNTGGSWFPNVHNAPGTLPDDQNGSLVYVALTGFGETVQLYVATGGETPMRLNQDLDDGEKVGYKTRIANGRVVYSIAKHDSPGALYSVSVDGGESIRLSPEGLDVGEPYPDFEVTNTHVVYHALTQSGHWELFSVPLTGGESTQLSPNDDDLGSYSYFVAGDDVFFHAGQLFKARLVGEPEIFPLTSESFDPFNRNFQVDDGKIYFHGSDTRRNFGLHELDLATSEHQFLGRLDSNWELTPGRAVSWNDSLISMVTRDGSETRTSLNVPIGGHGSVKGIDTSQTNQLFFVADTDGSGQAAVYSTPLTVSYPVQLIDDDASVSISFASDQIEEGSQTTATVTRNGDLSSILVATIVNNRPDELSTVNSITIPAGASTSAAFVVSAVDDAKVDGAQSVQLTATADNLRSGSGIMTIVDNESGSAIDIDGDDSTKALTDGLLIIRYLAGFRGTSLIDGAVDPTGHRTTAATIEKWMTDHRDIFMDIDGDGRFAPLSDGILAIRYLAGFRSTSLVTGAVGSNATRSTAESVTAYLDAHAGTARGPVYHELSKDKETELWSFGTAMRRQ